MTHIVITTDTDDRYHTGEECAAFRASHAAHEAPAKGRRRIVQITVADAEEFGRRPCTVCGAQERANAEQPQFLRELLADLSSAEKRRRQAWIRRERIRANGPVERFTVQEIGDRDRWVCGLCHDPVDPPYKARARAPRASTTSKPSPSEGPRPAATSGSPTWDATTNATTTPSYSTWKTPEEHGRSSTRSSV